jgi:hypothetical protein
MVIQSDVTSYVFFVSFEVIQICRYLDMILLIIPIY